MDQENDYKTIQVIEIDSVLPDKKARCIQETKNVHTSKVKDVVKALVENYNPERFVVRVV